MITISKIEIQHFRSIEQLTIENLNHINIFSGINDVGKSNIMKALNLFFTDTVDWRGKSFDISDYFYRDNKKGRKDTVTITLHFKTSGKKEFPSEFWIQRRWSAKHNSNIENTWGTYTPRVKNPTNGQTFDDGSTFDKFFREVVRFLYVPAVRESEYFDQLLIKLLNDTISDDIRSHLEKLFKSRSELSEINNYIKQSIGISASFDYTDVSGLLNQIRIVTDNNKIPLSYRGDGIKSLSINGLISYYMNQTTQGRYGNKFPVWILEEPETSLEYRRVEELANNLVQQTNNAQIFITTHSPSFIALNNPNVSLFRVYRHEGTKAVSVGQSAIKSNESELMRRQLVDELGYIDVLKKVDEEADRIYREYEEQKERIKKLEKSVNALQEPILLVEGKHDDDTLKIAWEKCFPSEKMPFNIKAAGSSGDLTELLRVLSITNTTNRIFGLYDYEKDTIAKLDKLAAGSNGTYENLSRDPYEYRSIHSSFIKAGTLLIPVFRANRKKIQNMPMEFYFTDDILQSAEGLISKTRYVDSYGDLLKKDSKIEPSPDNWAIDDDGKKELINSIKTLDSQHFLPFHPLFKMITAHLVPEFVLPEPAS